jgi:DNA-binding protein H-NS
MTAIVLDTLSLKDLKSLQKDLAKAIACFEDRQKADARAKVKALAKELDFNFADLMGNEGVKSTHGPARPKYRHPENPGLNWSGRGRELLWFINAIGSGKSQNDLASRMSAVQRWFGKRHSPAAQSAKAGQSQIIPQKDGPWSAVPAQSLSP